MEHISAIQETIDQNRDAMPTEVARQVLASTQRLYDGLDKPNVTLTLTPAITDRHGYLLKPGNTVTKTFDDSSFVIKDVRAVGSEPVTFLLADDAGGVVDASLVMLADSEKEERATFCETCFNHFEGGVTWFKASYDHPKGTSVRSSCAACLVDVDRASLPEVAWTA
jgi:hypothetical protein